MSLCCLEAPYTALMRLRRLLPLAALGSAVWYVRHVYRFRDPVRVSRAPAGSVISPADGVVCFVRRVTDGQVEADGVTVPVGTLTGNTAADGWLLGVAVGPLDVHYTYLPVSGTVGTVTYTPATAAAPLLSPLEQAALLARRPTALLDAPGLRHNERLGVTVHTDLGDVAVTMVAPGPPLDAMPYVKEGDHARAGYKLAFLPRGGLVTVSLPDSVTPLVSVGDHVTGMQTVFARA